MAGGLLRLNISQSIRMTNAAANPAITAFHAVGKAVATSNETKTNTHSVTRMDMIISGERSGDGVDSGMGCRLLIIRMCLGIWLGQPQNVHSTFASRNNTFPRHVRANVERLRRPAPCRRRDRMPSGELLTVKHA